MDMVRDIRICWSAVQDQGHDQTIYQQVAEAVDEAGFMCGVTVAERNRVAGKQLVHELLRWRPIPPVKSIIGEYDWELANRIERMHGTEALQKYVDYFAPEPEELNLPKLQIFSRSPEGRDNNELIECIPSCVYDETKKEDVKEFDGDDPYDCLRIGSFAIRDFLDDAKDEHLKFQRFNRASTILRESNDQTSFYRQCEAIEAAERVPISVRRQSRRFHTMSRMSGIARTVRH